MKFSIIAATSALLGSASAAQLAIVINSCTSPIYVQSVPYDGSASGPLTEVQPGGQFSETQRASGSTVKIGTTKSLAHPLFFGYSFSSSPDDAYYQFSTEYGNPFASDYNTLGAGAGCAEFNCTAGDTSCYSTTAIQKVYSCPQPVNLTAHICV